MKENERPLFLSLLWGTAHSGHGFRLRDQMEAEPVWCEFKENELEGNIDKIKKMIFLLIYFNLNAVRISNWLVNTYF